MHRPPLPQNKSLVLIFRGCVDHRAHSVGSHGKKKSPVTLPGIDPGTVRLVAQCLNHYAIPGPVNVEVEDLNGPGLITSGDEGCIVYSGSITNWPTDHLCTGKTPYIGSTVQGIAHPLWNPRFTSSCSHESVYVKACNLLASCIFITC